MSEKSNKNLFRTAVVLGLLSIGLIAKNILSNEVHPTSNADLAKVSVKVTRPDGRSGGSGVILNSSKKGSQVLTNEHVCQILKNGGKLTSDNKTATVTSFKTSEIHDLCLVETSTDLGLSTSIANNYPPSFSEAIVTGHPLLFPTVITKGHFSHYMDITLMKGVRECTPEELDSELGLICIFLGGMPIFRSYESQLISATILPGNSGSPVFDDSGQISGVVFAGTQGLSYGLIVPIEYVKNFVENEVPKLKPQLPNNEISVEDAIKESKLKKQRMNKFRKICEENLNEKIQEVCNKHTAVELD